MSQTISWREQLQRFLDVRHGIPESPDSGMRRALIRQINQDITAIDGQYAALYQRRSELAAELRQARDDAMHTPPHSRHYLPLIQTKRKLSEELTVIEGELHSVRQLRRELYLKATFVAKS